MWCGDSTTFGVAVATLATGSILGRPGSFKRPKPLCGSLLGLFFILKVFFLVDFLLFKLLFLGK